MKRRLQSLLLIGTLASLALGPGSEAHAALNAYLKLKGQKQGAIQGSVVKKGVEGSLPIISFNHEVVSPRDPASGLPTGKRQHKPFTFLVGIGKSSPQLYQALFTGELLPEVELVVFAAGDKSATSSLYSVKLSNAVVSQIRIVTPPGGVEALELSLVYQRIDMTWTDGGVTVGDDWEAPIGKPPPKPLPKPAPAK